MTSSKNIKIAHLTTLTKSQSFIAADGSHRTVGEGVGAQGQPQGSQGGGLPQAGEGGGAGVADVVEVQVHCRTHRQLTDGKYWTEPQTARIPKRGFNPQLAHNVFCISN